MAASGCFIKIGSNNFVNLTCDRKLTFTSSSIFPSIRIFRKVVLMLNAGIIDENVQAAECGLYLAQHPPDIVFPL